jgi:mycoredoxin
VSDVLTIYSTQWCGYCRRLKRQLEAERIDFAEVDIEVTEGAADYVMSVNGGNQTVPTVVLPDGTVLTNPTLAHIVDRLAA